MRRPARDGSRRGGARDGAGRKPNVPGAPGVSHRTRPPLSERHPVRARTAVDAFHQRAPQLFGEAVGELLESGFAERHPHGALVACVYDFVTGGAEKLRRNRFG